MNSVWKRFHSWAEALYEFELNWRMALSTHVFSDSLIAFRTDDGMLTYQSPTRSEPNDEQDNKTVPDKNKI